MSPELNAIKQILDFLFFFFSTAIVLLFSTSFMSLLDSIILETHIIVRDGDLGAVSAICAGGEPRSDEAETGRRRGRPPRWRTVGDKITQPSLFTALLGLKPKGPSHSGLQKRSMGLAGRFQKARLDHLSPRAAVDNIY